MTMKRVLRIAAVQILAFVGACIPPCQADEPVVSLFADMQFRGGFLLGYADPAMGRKVEAVLKSSPSEAEPVWRLCQWATQYSLADVPCTRSLNGDITWENAGKKVVVGVGGDLVLDIRGKAEYGEHVRQAGESWPHLLIEQDATRIHRLSDLASVDLAIDLRLLSFEDHLPAGRFDPGLHAAQFQLFFIVRNINPDSPGHNNYIWFGVPFFDSRHDIPPAYMAPDAGKKDATGKFIYTIDGRQVNQTPMKEGTWTRIQTDLLPHIRQALTTAAKRSYLKSSNPEDFAVVNMNLGWEIPGAYNAAVQLKSLKINARPLPELSRPDSPNSSLP
ncbi:MAG: hypothetical protein IH624_08090 [Phycisphaerae bacterium]|nr:hypothetical protein [Phycisphaerae bacterium]